MDKFKISIVFLMLTIQASAQQNTTPFKEKYEKEAIYFSGARYVKNNIAYHPKYLKNEFKSSAEGMNMYKMYQSDNRKGWKCATLGLVSCISAIVVGINGNERLGKVLLLGSLIPSGLAIHFGLRGDKRMKKAVWLRNRDMLLH